MPEEENLDEIAVCHKFKCRSASPVGDIYSEQIECFHSCGFGEYTPATFKRGDKCHFNLTVGQTKKEPSRASDPYYMEPIFNADPDYP